MPKIKMTPEQFNFSRREWYVEGHTDAMFEVLRQLKLEHANAMYEFERHEVGIEYVNAISYVMGVVSQLSRVDIKHERVGNVYSCVDSVHDYRDIK